MWKQPVEAAGEGDERELRLAPEAVTAATTAGAETTSAAAGTETTSEPVLGDPSAVPHPSLTTAGTGPPEDLLQPGAVEQTPDLDREAAIDPRSGPLAGLVDAAPLTDALGVEIDTATDVGKATGFDTGLSVDRIGLNLDPFGSVEADSVAAAVAHHSGQQVSGGGGDSTSPAEEKGVLDTIIDVATDVLKAVFDKTPEPLSTLAPLASEEGAAAEQGAFNLLQEKDAKDSSDLGSEEGNEEYYRLRAQSTADFYKSKTQSNESENETETDESESEGGTSAPSGSGEAQRPVNPDWGDGGTSPGSPGDVVLERPSVIDPAPDETDSSIVVDPRAGIPKLEAAPYDPNPLDAYGSVVEAGPLRQPDQVYDPAPDSDATDIAGTVTVNPYSGGPGIVGPGPAPSPGSGGGGYETAQSAMMKADPDDEPPPEAGSVAGGGSLGGEWGDLGAAASSVASAAAAAGAAVESAGEWVDDQARTAGAVVKNATNVFLDAAQSTASSAARAAGGVLSSDWADRAIGDARDAVEGAVVGAVDSLVNTVDDATDVVEAAGSAAQGDWAAAGEKALDASGILTGGFVDVEQDPSGTHISITVPGSGMTGPAPSVGGGGELEIDVGGGSVDAQLTSTTPVGSGSITTTSDVGLTGTDDGLEASVAVEATSRGLASSVPTSQGSEVLPTAVGASGDMALGATGVDLTGSAWSESDGLLLGGSSTASAEVHLGADGIAASARQDTSGHAGLVSFSDSTAAEVSLDASGLGASFERSHELAALGMTDAWSTSAEVEVGASGVDVAGDAEYIHVDPALGTFGVSAGTSGVRVEQPLGPGLADAESAVSGDDSDETAAATTDTDSEPIP